MHNKMDYDIFTICTKNFKDAYDFVIDSWLLTDVKKIYIYTDDKLWISKNNRVEIVSVLKETTDWMKIIGNKSMVCRDMLKFKHNTIFLDIDCFLTDDLGHIFKQDFDFAVTRLITENPQLRVSTGIIFMKYNKKLFEFMNDWILKQELIESKITRPIRTCSYNQDAFSQLIRQYHKEKKYKIVEIDVKIYNRKMKPGMEHTIFPELEKIKVMHFYNTSYRNKDYIQKVFSRL